LIKPGVLLSDISTKIEETIKGFGFNPVRNLTGHGLERFHLHAEPSVPNVTFRSDYRLEEGQVIAIEPFATTGEGRVRETEPVLIFMVLEDKPVRNQDARTIMRFAQQSNGLPFAERWLPGTLFKIRLAMRELREKGALYDYAPLKEVSNGIVSQHEHTVIVKDEPIVTTK
jgi:methionyl aminopeptidase